MSGRRGAPPSTWSGTAASGGRSTTGEGRFPESLGDGRPAGFLALPLPGGLLLATEPADGPPPAGDPLSVALAGGVRALRLERQLKEKHFQANYRGVELEALYDVGLAIASTLDLDRLAEEVLLRAVSLLDARRGALYLLEDGRYRLDRTFGGDARPSFAADENVEGLIGDDGAAAADLLPGARYLLAVPIESDGRRRGLLLVGDKESRSGVGPFPDHDRRTLALFANQAAIALENARLHRQALEKERLEREMELAAEIQRQILPDRVPAVAGYDLAGWNRPARQVGGDYYDLAEAGGRPARPGAGRRHRQGHAGGADGVDPPLRPQAPPRPLRAVLGPARVSSIGTSSTPAPPTSSSP